MNTQEQILLDILKKGRNSYGFTTVRAEFEAEGARPFELCRLLEMGYKAGLGFTLKIGGCEAIRDLNEAKKFGANRVIAPMIESVYALTKYKKAIHHVYSLEDQKNTDFFFNIETAQSFTQLPLLIKETNSPLKGVIFGRVDFAQSSQLSRDHVDGPIVFSKAEIVAKTCYENQLDFIVGGGISCSSVPFLIQMKGVYLRGFETRKISFDPSILSNLETAVQALQLAAEFELLWLKNKQNYYKVFYEEDCLRITFLEQRVKLLS